VRQEDDEFQASLDRRSCLKKKKEKERGRERRRDLELLIRVSIKR
jgi:hypothetical protein